MFADIRTARRALVQRFGKADGAYLINLLQAAIELRPVGGQAEPALGRTRIGGTQPRRLSLAFT